MELSRLRVGERGVAASTRSRSASDSALGSDRTTAAGDVCNKIGTYLKALAAFDNGVPFYAWAGQQAGQETAVVAQGTAPRAGCAGRRRGGQA